MAKQQQDNPAQRTRWPELDAFDRLKEVLDRTFDPLMRELRASGKTSTKGSTAKLVLLGLVNSAYADDESYPSLKYLCGFASVQRDAVMQALDALEDGGLISTTNRRSQPGAKPWERTSLYRFDWDAILRVPTFKRKRRSSRETPLDDQSENPTGASRETRPDPVGKPDPIQSGFPTLQTESGTESLSSSNGDRSAPQTGRRTAKPAAAGGCAEGGKPETQEQAAKREAMLALGIAEPALTELVRTPGLTIHHIAEQRLEKQTRGLGPGAIVLNLRALATMAEAAAAKLMRDEQRRQEREREVAAEREAKRAEQQRGASEAAANFAAVRDMGADEVQRRIAGLRRDGGVMPAILRGDPLTSRALADLIVKWREPAASRGAA